VRIRLVKGANLAMESVEAEMRGWNPAPYATKAETDANFKRMLEFGCRPENARAVNLGVASHNLFDLALALVLRRNPALANLSKSKCSKEWQTTRRGPCRRRPAGCSPMRRW